MIIAFSYLLIIVIYICKNRRIEKCNQLSEANKLCQMMFLVTGLETMYVYYKAEIRYIFLITIVKINYIMKVPCNYLKLGMYLK